MWLKGPGNEGKKALASMGDSTFSSRLPWSLLGPREVTCPLVISGWRLESYPSQALPNRCDACPLGKTMEREALLLLEARPTLNQADHKGTLGHMGG